MTSAAEQTELTIEQLVQNKIGMELEQPIRVLNFSIKFVCDVSSWANRIDHRAFCSRFRTLIRPYYRGAAGMALVYDVTDAKTFHNIEVLGEVQLEQ